MKKKNIIIGMICSSVLIGSISPILVEANNYTSGTFITKKVEYTEWEKGELIKVPCKDKFDFELDYKFVTMESKVEDNKWNRYLVFERMLPSGIKEIVKIIADDTEIPQATDKVFYELIGYEKETDTLIFQEYERKQTGIQYTLKK